MTVRKRPAIHNGELLNADLNYDAEVLTVVNAYNKQSDKFFWSIFLSLLVFTLLAASTVSILFTSNLPVTAAFFYQILLTVAAATLFIKYKQNKKQLAAAHAARNEELTRLFEETN